MPEDISSEELNNAASILAFFLGSCKVEEDGTVIETRQLVHQISGVRIEIYADEHPPPHFHVRTAAGNAAYTIAECKRLVGDLPGNHERIVRYWHRGAGMQMLISAWNATRPGDCSVGEYRP